MFMKVSSVLNLVAYLAFEELTVQTFRRLRAQDMVNGTRSFEPVNSPRMFSQTEHLPGCRDSATFRRWRDSIGPPAT